LSVIPSPFSINFPTVRPTGRKNEQLTSKKSK
jgi:hypothetical protein